MRNYFVCGVAVVDGWFEYLNAFAGDARAAQAADQFFALAREHGPANDFDPPDVACYQFHVET